MLIVVYVPAATAAMGAVLFVSAGRWDLPMFWAAVAVTALVSLAALLWLDAGLLKERLKPGRGGRDWWTIYLSKLLITGALVVAGLDVGRLHWSDSVPVFAQVVGLIGLALGFGLTVWCMTVNPFFSPVVRLQAERGHRVITGGPYRFVRHPGYAGIMVGMPCLGLALGSWLSILAMFVFNLAVLRRLRIEDQFLRSELKGYATYTERVPYRLVPGVW